MSESFSGDHVGLSFEDLPAGDAAGVFGHDDALGCLNRLTPERVAAAATLVRRGHVFSLNAPLDWPKPALFGRRNIEHHAFDTPRGNRDDYIDTLYPQASSQWDGFLHIRTEAGVLYNRLSSEQLGIEHWARRGIVGRGVLLDVARWRDHRGRPINWLERDVISVADLVECREAEQVDVRNGDVLLVRTGWAESYRSAGAGKLAALNDLNGFVAPGLGDGEDMASLLWNWGLAAIAADNPALEAWPFVGRGLHERLIPKLGLPIGELWWLDELAAACADDEVYEFLFTSAPLHVVGGVGSTANALAIR